MNECMVDQFLFPYFNLWYPVCAYIIFWLNILISFIMYAYWIYWFTGEIDSAKTVFLRFHSTIVLKAGFYHSIAIEPKDCYGNPAAIDQSKLDIEIRKVKLGSLCYIYGWNMCIQIYRTVLRGLWLIQSFLLIEMLLPSMNCTWKWKKLVITWDKLNTMIRE